MKKVPQIDGAFFLPIIAGGKLKIKIYTLEYHK